MKTKVLRFNKLPKIEGSQQIDVQGLQARDRERANVRSRQSNLRTTSGFKRPDMQFSGQLASIFDSLMKKSIKQVRDFELEARDRSVMIDIPQLQAEEEFDDETLKEWVTDVCNNVFSSAFHSLSKDAMTYEHTKIFCSEGILKNIVQLTKRYHLNERQMKLINQHIQERIVPYMQKKYPLTESSDVNKAIDEKVKPIDNREALQNDLLQKCDVVFTYRHQGNYNDLIMRLLNWLMTEIDTTSPTTKLTAYEDFYNFISKMFQNVCNEDWMNERSLKSKKDVEGGQTERNQQQLEKNFGSINDPANKQKYAAKVKEYTHYAIGRKISKNVPIYSEEEIQSGHLTIKSPSILRILTKWAEELWGKFKTKNYFLDREQNMRVQQKGGNVNTMFMWMKMPLNDLIQEEKVKIQAFMKELQENNFDQQSRLLLRQLERDGFTHIEKIEKACGKFAYKTVNNLHSYIVLYLNRMIHGLLTASKQLYDTKLSTKARWTSPPDLLSFKIGDLMRCKCSSKQRQIIKIFQYLLEESQKTPEPNQKNSKTNQKGQKAPKLLKIIRVKNRLKLGTNDILINVIFQEKYLCQIQLAVKSATSKFIQCSNLFSHYVYQLGRTLFGPLTQLCSVWTSLDPRAIQYLNLIKNQQRTATSEPLGCKKKGMTHDYVDLDRPFVCSDCNRAYSHTNFLWMHQKCTKEDCGHMICALCQIQNQSYERLKESLLKDEDKALQSACTAIVNRKSESEKVLPTYGVCIKIESKRIRVHKFKKLEYNRILTLYGLKKDKKTQKEVVIKMEQLVKRDAQRRFLKKYLVFEIPEEFGEKLIKIDLDRAKKQYIIPQKIKQIYKKQQQILSLINENLDNKSIQIMKGAQDDMQNIMNMQLADNQLTDIKFITANFPKLDRLQLSRNKICNVDTVSKLKGMKKLNLRNNELAILPDQICDLPLLEGLNIRYNKLKALPDNFGNLKNMKKLESDNNQFSDLPESFSKLTKLTFLDFSKNKFTKFPEAIQNFTKLKELALAKNKLDVVPEWIGNFKELTSLDLSKTNLKNLPASIFSLINLQTLKVETSYSSIPEQVGKLLKLKHLCLRMPNLSRLPRQMFTLTNNLQTLELEECKISELPDWLSDMKRLQTFSLINNNLSNLSREITQMTNIKYLKIQGQNISKFPPNMENLVELRTISLDNNKFTQLPSSIKAFGKLYSLTCKNNQIELIEDDFFELLPNLETLALENNKLNRLPESIEKLARLKVLTFENNAIQNRPEWIQNVKNLVHNTYIKSDDFSLKKNISADPK